MEASFDPVFARDDPISNLNVCDHGSLRRGPLNLG